LCPLLPQLRFRHAHPMREGGISDVFIMVELKLADVAGADAITIQESEIAEAKWMPMAEVTALEYYKTGGMLYEMVLAAAAEKGQGAQQGQDGGFSGRKLANGRMPGHSMVYRSRL